MTESERKKVLTNMANNLQMLRVRLGLTQNELADKLGISRHTVMNIENKKRNMEWNNFLALLLLFSSNEDTSKLLSVLEIYTDEIDVFLKQRNGSSSQAKTQK